MQVLVFHGDTLFLTKINIINNLLKETTRKENQMINFFYNGLNYPRSSVSDLLKFATKHNFRLKLITIEPPHYNKKSTKYTKQIKNFWEIIKKNYPKYSQ